MKKPLIPVACLFYWRRFTSSSEAQVKKIRVAIPGYTISMVSFLAAKINGYYSAEGLAVDLIATRAPTANLAVLSGSGTILPAAKDDAAAQFYDTRLSTD